MSKSSKGGQFERPLGFEVHLNSIDGIENSDVVITVITTKHIERLDPALGASSEGEIATRPGRIDRVIKLDLLDENCRRTIAKRILCDCPEHIETIIEQGKGETGAQFQDRCSKLALKEFWLRKDKKKLDVI